MSDTQSSYRQIFKATSLFGGVQVFNILINIARSKIIAVLLGPSGMGIFSLLNSTTGLVAGLTNFGLGTSAVKNVSAAHATGDKERIATTVTILRRLVWFTGLLGAILTAVLSPWLSQLTFGNKDYTFAFIWIAITLLLNQISVGQGVVLRGMRKLSFLARSSVLGSLFGLVFTVPFYYLFGVKGIVPAIIITSAINLLLTWYFANKVKIANIAVANGTALIEGKDMLKMGIMLSISGIFVLTKNYVLRAYISNAAGLDEVGLYSAGMTIVSSYVGMVFTAMAADYYPRLSAISKDNFKVRKLVNEQSEIAILILAPIISVFIIFITRVIVLLYSNEFLPITLMVQWAALGMFFRATGWATAFIYLAKGDSKVYLANELFGGTITFICHLLGYYLGGLTGMGIGFLVGYVYYTLQVVWITHRRYGFMYDRDFLKIFIIQILLVLTCFLSVLLIPKPWTYLISFPFLVVSMFFSYNELDKRIGINQLLKKTIKKK